MKNPTKKRREARILNLCDHPVCIFIPDKFAVITILPSGRHARIVKGNVRMPDVKAELKKQNGFVERGVGGLYFDGYRAPLLFGFTKEQKSTASDSTPP